MAEGALDAVAAGAADGPLNVENVSLRHRLRALCNQQLPHAEAWRDAWWEHLLSRSRSSTRIDAVARPEDDSRTSEGSGAG